MTGLDKKELTFSLEVREKFSWTGNCALTIVITPLIREPIPRNKIHPPNALRKARQMAYKENHTLRES